jgi:hypothetical protein
MWQAFNGQTISYRKAEHWALSETPFVNPKSMLRTLESQERLVADVVKGMSRKRGDFPEDKIAGLNFGQFGSRMQQSELF